MTRNLAFRRAIVAAIAIVTLVGVLAFSGILPDPFGTLLGATRGKSQSVPDSDGTGADKGLPGPDKPAQGGDGNNGCGNDRDGEDDNNGNCFGVLKARYKKP
jgi:hypothetical protein